MQRQGEIFAEGNVLAVVGSEIRIRIGEGDGELREDDPRFALLVERLSFKNPQLNKLRTRLISAVRGATGLEHADARDAGNRLFGWARENKEDFGTCVRQAKHVMFNEPEKVVSKLNWPKVKRVAQCVYATARTDEEIVGCRRDHDDFLHIPRGAWEIVKETLGDGSSLDCRTPGDLVPFGWVGQEFRPYQHDATHALLRSPMGCGTLVLPCGSGKTFTGLRAAYLVARRTVVLVPTKEIRDEWINECETCLGFRPGEVGDGKFEVDPRLTVVINATAVRLSDEQFEEVFGSAGVLIVDECPCSVAKGNRSVIERVAAAHRWGLTATPFREDGLDPVIQWVVGPVRYSTSQSELAEQGYLLLPSVEGVQTSWECPDGIDPSNDYNDMVVELIRDDNRNAFALDVIGDVARRHKRILVLTCRTEHAILLAKKLQATGFSAEAVHSTLRKSRRKEIMQAFRDGEVKIITAVKIADQGLNIPELDGGVVAGPVKAKAKSIQRLGRLMRPLDGKAPELVDIYDPRVPVLKRQWFARRKAYKEALGG